MVPIFSQVPNGTYTNRCTKIAKGIGGHSYFLSVIGYPSLRMETEVAFFGALEFIAMYSSFF